MAQKKEMKMNVKSSDITPKATMADMSSLTVALNPRQITVKNIDGTPDTTATILIQNQIDYIPKVSVIIPVYNIEKYLRECLDSVVNQTLKEIEIVCVDDGSMDSSLDILKEYAQKDKRITVITQKNLYAGIARNAALSVAKGKYINFVDSDDVIEPNSLETAFNECETNQAEMGIWNGRSFENGTYRHLNWVVDATRLNDRQIFSCANDDIASYVFQTFCGWPMNKLYSRTLLERNKYRFSSTHHHNDTAFVMSNVVSAQKVVYIPALYYNYRIVPGSISRNKDKQVSCFYQSLMDTYANIKNLPFFSRIERSFINYVVDFSVHYYEHLRLEKSKEEAEELCQKLYNQFVLGKEADYFYNRKKFDKFKETICKIYDKIPIILSSDDNYAPYMYVSMFSILKNANPDTYYDFYLLIPDKFSELKKKSFLDLEKEYKCDVHFINLENTFKDTKMSIDHISYVTYFRLLAADLLPKKYHKCLYVDTDICCCGDLRQLYDYPIGDNYLAGVSAATYYFKEKEHCKRLNLPSARNYINAGVLIMNLEQIRKDGLTPKFLSLMKNNYESQDQDIINVVCYGRIALLPLKFNLMTKYNGLFDSQLSSSKKLAGVYGENNIKEALAHPVIIHFASKEKPWQNKRLPLANVWWNYAKQTHFFKKGRADFLKAYALFPFNLLCLILLRRKLKCLQGKPSKLFSIVKTPYKKVYRVFGLKWIRSYPYAEIVDLIKKHQVEAYRLFDKIEARYKLLQEENIELKRQFFDCFKRQKDDFNRKLNGIKNTQNELYFADLLHDSIVGSSWLKDQTFSLYNWAANYSLMYILFRVLDNMRPQAILEFGLGQTTKLTSQYVANSNPSAILDVIEDNQYRIDTYKPQLALNENIHISRCDLEFFDFNNVSNRKYKDLSSVIKNQQYNLIIVDGPYGAKQSYPRSNIVDLVATNLAEDFVIIFDDASRAGEQNTINKTKEKLNELGIKFIENKRVAYKTQILLISKSMDFVQYL